MHWKIEPIERRILMAITATFNAGAQQLTVTGDALANAITISRDAPGTILVNGGAVAVAGGTPTVANTNLITVNGLDGDDAITFDEANGPLPASQLNGGNGNDTLTGGSGPDAIDGGGGNDTELGKAGIDTLLGGAGNDVLTGGDGDDQAFGGADNDRMIWNPGDDTDLNEGGDGTADVVEVNGGAGAEVFTAGPNGARVRFDRVSPAPFAIDIGTSESLVVNMGGGDDAFSTTGALSGLIQLTIDGGANNDSISGSNGVDVLIGGDGNDFIDGNAAADTAFMGNDDDVFQWDPGDGSDIVEGQAGTDRLRFNGSAGAEHFDASPNGGRMIFLRDLGSILMDCDNVEVIDLNAAGGIDTFTLNDLASTDVTQANVDLSGTIGSGVADGAADTVVVNATGAADVVQVSGAGTVASVTGLATALQIDHADATLDRLNINLLGGDDQCNAPALPAGILLLTVDGGLNDDSINGSGGADVLIGGDNSDFIDGNPGADTAFLGNGDDLFQWDPGDGSDVIEGQAGADTLRFNGAAGAEQFDFSPNGGRVRFFRNLGNIVMDCDDVETINLNALGGADVATVNDMTGTDLTAANIDLASAIGGGASDAAADAVVVNFPGSNTAANVIDTAAGTEVTGGVATVRVAHADAALDSLQLNTSAGSDTTTVNQLGAPGTVRRVLVDGGADNDTLHVVSTPADGTVVVLPNAGDETVNVNTDGVGIANAAFEATQRLAALSIGSGGVARLVAGGEKVLTAAALNLAGTAQLDLTDNNMILDYTGASPAATFRARLLSGFAGGAWTGPGIISSTAQTVTNSGVGLAEATDLFTAFPATFKGQSVDNTSLLLAHALYGDADLSGNVNLADFNLLAGNFGGTNKRWSQGDFNYDGNTNLQDFNRLAANWGLAGAPSAASKGALPDTRFLIDDLLA